MARNWGRQAPPGFNLENSNMDTTTNYERRLPTEYERGFVLRSLTDHGLPMLSKIAYRQIKRTREYHGVYESWNGEFLELANQAIQKFTTWWLEDNQEDEDNNQAELTTTDKQGKPISLDQSAMSVFKFRCCYRDICYSPRATTTVARTAEHVSPKWFDDPRCEHRMNPRHVADSNGVVIADSNNGLCLDNDSDEIPESYFFTNEQQPETTERVSRWSFVKHRILTGCKPSTYCLEDEMAIAAINRERREAIAD